MKAQKNNSTYKFNRSQIFKKANLLFIEGIEKDINNKTSKFWGLCLKQSWQLAKETKDRVLNGVSENKPEIVENIVSNITIKQEPLRPVIINDLDFNKVYKENYNKIVNMLSYNLFGNFELAQDLASEVFIKLYKSINTFDSDKSKIGTYIHMIAKRTLIDYFRKVKLNAINISHFSDNETGKETFQIVDNDSNNETENIQTEQNTNLIKAIKNLKPNYKDVLELYYNEKKSYTEIAEILNITIHNVKIRINRAKLQLESIEKQILVVA